MKRRNPYFKDHTWTYLDGGFIQAKEAHVSPYSQSLHYGIGAFEGMRSYETKIGPQIFRLKAHYDRLLLASEKIHLSFPYTFDQFRNACYELLRRNDFTDAYLRPIVYAGPNMTLGPSPESHLMILAWKWGKLLGDKPLKMTISSAHYPDISGPLARTKVCGNYVHEVLATVEANKKGCDGAIMLHQDGKVASAAGANLFMEKNEVLYTPISHKIFPGITRDTIVELAGQLGLEVREKEITREDLYEADGIFLTGTATEVSPVQWVDGHAMKMNWTDTLGLLLSRKYRQLVTMVDSENSTLI